MQSNTLLNLATFKFKPTNIMHMHAKGREFNLQPHPLPLSVSFGVKTLQSDVPSIQQHCWLIASLYVQMKDLMQFHSNFQNTQSSIQVSPMEDQISTTTDEM